MPEKPEEFYSRHLEEFSEKYALEKLSPEYIELLDDFIENVEEGKVLDAGCGHGRDVEYFVDNGLEAVGIDLAEEMVEYAKHNKKGEFHLMNIKNLDFEDGEFDGIWCNKVLIFLPSEEWKDAVKELWRVLKNSGILHISLKAGEGHLMREKFGGAVKQYLTEKQKAAEILESNGFKILDVKETQTHRKNHTIEFICEKDN